MDIGFGSFGRGNWLAVGEGAHIPKYRCFVCSWVLSDVPRDIPLSNGSLYVSFDLGYRIADLCFPHVGKDNHAVGHPFKVGVWADGAFSWLGEDWRLDRHYEADTMVADVTARNEGLGIELHFEDAVDFYEDVLLRQVRVTNLRAGSREIRVFFHQDFHIDGNADGDTAVYEPDVGALLHYKHDRYFLVNCRVGDKVGVPTWTCGEKEANGREGTWRDAEDGELQSNPVVQGSVDSTLGVPLKIAGGGNATFDYWIAAGCSFQEVRIIDSVVRDKSPDTLRKRTRDYWRLWVTKGRPAIDGLSQLAERRYSQSLAIMRAQIDRDGAVVAAVDSDIEGFARDTYAYVWPRDGSLASLSLMGAGHVGTPERFFAFCDRVIAEQGFMRHKYTPDGLLGSSWEPYIRDGQRVLPIQEDETALVVFAVSQFFARFQRVEEMAPYYRRLVTRPAEFMVGYVDERTGLPQPSTDIWEERWGVHSYSVGCVVAGLRGAADVAEAFGETDHAARYRQAADRMLAAMREVLWNPAEGRLARMARPTPHGYELDVALDASLLGIGDLGIIDPGDPQFEATARQIEEQLWVRTEIGGLARYRDDRYQQVEKRDLDRVPGNPWFIGTLWLARWHLLREGRDHRARGLELIEWAASRALPSGVMAEQLHPYTGAPLSVSPLTWSHGAYVRAVLALIGA